MGFTKQWNACKKIKNDKNRQTCTFKVLYNITQLQDKIQLSLPRTDTNVAHSQDLINDANAVILELSKNQGDLPHVKKLGYYDEKATSFCRKYHTY